MSIVQKVSILVFLEWPLGRRTRCCSCIGQYRFQSLFFWNGLWDASACFANAIVSSGFNPCFSGMAFGTLIGLIRRIVGLLFQSLFFWNGLWDKRCPPEAGVICLAFQSLFFWNGLWDICQGLLRRSGSTFQSLFFWNGLWDVGQALLGAAELVFQSLFFWNGLWDSPPRRG